MEKVLKKITQNGQKLIEIGSTSISSPVHHGHKFNQVEGVGACGGKKAGSVMMVVASMNRFLRDFGGIGREHCLTPRGDELTTL